MSEVVDNVSTKLTGLSANSLPFKGVRKIMLEIGDDYAATMQRCSSSMFDLLFKGSELNYLTTQRYPKNATIFNFPEEPRGTRKIHTLMFFVMRRLS